MAQYESNEVAADAYYKGNIFDIVGIVTGIKKDLGDDLYVTLDGRGASRFRSVQAYFDRGMASNLGALRKGQRLTVRCRIDGLFINVQAKGCTLP